MRDQLIQLLRQLCESSPFWFDRGDGVFGHEDPLSMFGGEVSYLVADDAVYYDEFESMSFEDAFQRFSLDV